MMIIRSFEGVLYKKFVFCMTDIRMKEVLLHDDNMVRTNHLIVGIDNKCDHMQHQPQNQQQDQQHPPSSTALIKPQCGRAMGHTSGSIQFRDSKSAPLQKLSIDLISTYKRINQVCALIRISDQAAES